jgi:hypothetical protein
MEQLHLPFAMLAMSNKMSFLYEFSSVKSARQYERRNQHRFSEFVLLIWREEKYQPAIPLEKGIYSQFSLHLKSLELQARYEVIKASLIASPRILNSLI